MLYRFTLEVDYVRSIIAMNKVGSEIAGLIFEHSEISMTTV